MKELAGREKIVAVGEIGLDHYWDTESDEVQRKWFIRQLELAKEVNLPGHHCTVERPPRSPLTS